MISNIDITNRINRTPDYRIDLSKIKNFPLNNYIDKYKESNYKESNEWSNNIGNYINYNNNQDNIYEYIDEIIIDIDNTYKNNNDIFSFNYELQNKLININYIDINNVCIPNNIFIYKILLNNIDNDIIKNINLIKNNNNLLINNKIYNIHNYYKEDDNTIIYYSIDKNYNIVYNLIINNNNIIKNDKNEIINNINNINNNSKLYLSITNLDNHLMETTSNINYYNMLYIDKIINNNLYYKTKNCFHLYKKSNLLNLSKLKFNILLYQNNIPYNKFIDNNINIKNCNCKLNENIPGCKCIYILHPDYFKIIVSIRLGIYKIDLLNKIIK